MSPLIPGQSFAPGTSPLLPPAQLACHLEGLTVPPHLRKAALEWAEALTAYQDTMKEEANRSRFLDLVFHQGLGYAHGATAKGEVYTLREKPKTDKGNQFPDAALGLYGGPSKLDLTSAILELKDDGTSLDAKQGSGSYAKTPVEQGFGYALKYAYAQFVLVSNFSELRLYTRESGELRSWALDFRQLLSGDQDRLLKELWFFLAPERLVPHAPGHLPALLPLLREAPADQEKVTRAFYQEFRRLRDEARAHYLRLLQDRGDLDAPQRALDAAQKLLNRVLFAGFAQSRKLLPDGLLGLVAERLNFLEEKPLHRNLRMLFRHLDQGFRAHFVAGRTELVIPGFNGGLFRADPIVDGADFALSEDFAGRLLHLAHRDFLTELSVTVLGHCFESSLADLDAERGGQTRHDGGIYYTRDWVTRAICLRVLAPLVERCRLAAREACGPEPTEPFDRHRWGLQIFHRLWAEVGSLRILDPACGSGAFLAQGLRVLRELLEPDLRKAQAHASQLPDTHVDRVHEDFAGWSVEALTEREEALRSLQALGSLERCFFGVDLHEEAVLLTQLSLWLESAEKDRKLSDLSDRIKAANSLTADWEALFPGIRFDAVIGNPPYVRMELFKELKPLLKARFPEVHEERADLYCYFFQLSGELLKEGGRYGIIVSNKWLKAKYGLPSRAYLKKRFQLEALMDFGELPVFEDAAVMPVIVIGEKQAKGTLESVGFTQFTQLPKTTLEFDKTVNVLGRSVPADLLGDETWMLLNEEDGARFQRRSAKGISLREYLGNTPICWGIKTGLNEAFYLSQTQRDDLLSNNPEARDLIKPLVVGDDVRRWAIQQDEPRYLIYTPKGRFTEAEFEDRYKPVADHLRPFREYRDTKGKLTGLLHRATKQAWFELQQAQEAYEPYFSAPMLLWPDIAMEPRWCQSAPTAFSNTCYGIPTEDPFLLGVLNSRSTWDQLVQVASSLGAPSEGGRLRLFEGVMSQILLPPPSKVVANLVTQIQAQAAPMESHRRAFVSVLRAAPWRCAPLGRRLETFWEQDADTVLEEALKRRDKSQKKDPTLAQRKELKGLWREAAEPMRELAHHITKLEAELNAAVEAAWESA